MQKVDILNAETQRISTVKYWTVYFFCFALFAQSVAVAQGSSSCRDALDPDICMLQKSKPTIMELTRAAASTFFVPSTGCRDPSIAAFEQTAKEADRLTHDLILMAARQPTYDLREQVNRMVRLNLRSIAEIRVEVADHALKARCLDFADAQYRIVRSYYPPEYTQSAQNRAALGIEDIRELRKRPLQ